MALTLVQDVQTGGIPPVRFEAVVDKLPADFEPMRAVARAEGYAFLERLERLGVGRDAFRSTR
jgi:hypothetical protein